MTTGTRTSEPDLDQALAQAIRRLIAEASEPDETAPESD
jgi:hypothetical protein